MPSQYKRYIEPFAGSASLFFELQPPSAILGDINPCVVDVYRAIQEDAMGVYELLNSIPRSSEAYYLLRSVNPSDLSLTERAARLIFLMKACFNGVYRTNRLGIFNVPMGDKIYALPSKGELLSAQQLLQGTVLINGDFSKTLSECRPGDWIYLDPPYKKQGRFRGEYGYSAEFSDEHLTSLVSTATRLKDLGCFVVISYCYDEQLVERLPEWHVQHVTAQRSVASSSAKRGLAPELIIKNY